MSFQVPGTWNDILRLDARPASAQIAANA